MKPLILSLPLVIFEKLHEIAGRKGRGSDVTIKKKDLMALLIDHSRAIARLEDLYVTMEENYANSSKIRKARER